MNSTSCSGPTIYYSYLWYLPLYSPSGRLLSVDPISHGIWHPMIDVFWLGAPNGPEWREWNYFVLHTTDVYIV